MSMVTYQAQHTVHLGQIKSEIRAGETFQFDGQNLYLRGETHVLPSLKVAIDQGWFKQASTTAVRAAPKAASKAVQQTTGSLKGPVIRDQESANTLISKASSTPATSQAVQVRGVNYVSGEMPSSGFNSKVVSSDEDSFSTAQHQFSGSPAQRPDTVAGVSQEGKVVNRLFKTSTQNAVVIGNDSDLSRETSRLEKITATAAVRTGASDSRESQTVRTTGSNAVASEAVEDNSFITQTSDGVTMRVKGGFNRKAMQVVSMGGAGFMDENGVGAVVVNRKSFPVETTSVTQEDLEALESGEVLDVTSQDQKPFVWDMSKHWKTRIREAAQYKSQPEIYNQILAQETETVIKHLTA